MHNERDLHEETKVTTVLPERTGKHSEEAQLKGFLLKEFLTIVRNRELSAADVATMSGHTEDDLLAMMRGGFENFDLWRAMKLLSAVDADVAVGVKRAPKSGKGMVVWGTLD